MLTKMEWNREHFWATLFEYAPDGHLLPERKPLFPDDCNIGFAYCADRTCSCMANVWV
jgi:hypothetical protein